MEVAAARYGTVAWLFDRYLKSPAFEQRVSKRSRYEYRRALARIEDMPTKTGGTVAELPVSSITPAAVDKIYAKLAGRSARDIACARPICPSTSRDGLGRGASAGSRGRAG